MHLPPQQVDRVTAARAETVQVRHALRLAIADLPEGSLVIVACSGGADSCALAAAAAFVAPREGLRAEAVVIDHGLQPGSDRIAEWAARTCLQLGLSDAHVVRVEVGQQGGPESAARDARYAALRAQAQARGAAAVLLAHTMDDQAETVLLRLARGSGARSLAGMRPADGLLRRPFLGLSRATVHACAQDALGEIGERPWQDPHNEDRRYARPRVRAAMGVLGEALEMDLAASLARTAELLRDDADALDELAGREAYELVQADASGSSSEAIRLLGLPRALRTRVIRGMCLDAGCDAGALTAEHVWAVERLVTQWHGQGPTRLPGGVWAERRYGRLAIHRPPAPE